MSIYWDHHSGLQYCMYAHNTQLLASGQAQQLQSLFTSPQQTLDLLLLDSRSNTKSEDCLVLGLSGGNVFSASFLPPNRKHNTINVYKRDVLLSTVCKNKAK